jgi:DnaJ-class molecular chaperone
MLVKCRGCQGSPGKMTLIAHYFPRQENNIITCPGCGGDGMVNVPDPNKFCVRCAGSGKIEVKRLGTMDQSGGHTEHCPVCGGNGYAH